MNALQGVSLLLGTLGGAAGIWSLTDREGAQRFLKNLPRNQKIGRVLMAVNVVWSLYLLGKMNLGGWNWIRPPLNPGAPNFIIWCFLAFAIWWFIITYVNQYIGARSIALLLILAAKPILSICFLHEDQPWRLVITTIAYIWIIKGICIFSVPHWMRDIVAYSAASPKLWDRSCYVKIGCSVVLLLLGFFVY
jgi:hypothetical protein